MNETKGKLDESMVLTAQEKGFIGLGSKQTKVINYGNK